MKRHMLHRCGIHRGHIAAPTGWHPWAWCVVDLRTGLAVRNGKHNKMLLFRDEREAAAKARELSNGKGNGNGDSGRV